MESLDYSGQTGGDDSENIASSAAMLADPSKYGTKNKDGIYEVQDVTVATGEEGDDDSDGGFELLPDNMELSTTGNSSSSNVGGFFSFIKSMTGQKELTQETLDPVLSNMKEHLIKKNVASDIAEHLCQSVKSSLLGKKLGSFQRKSELSL